MRNLLISSVITFTFAASADVIKLTEFKKDRDTELYRTSFEVNKKLNRAWIEITMADSSFGDLYYSDIRAKVPGLSYSPEINGVVYNLNGEEVICGTFYNSPWTIDFGMSFRETGRCQFQTSDYVKETDDGFHVRKETITVVNLVIE